MAVEPRADRKGHGRLVPAAARVPAVALVLVAAAVLLLLGLRVAGTSGPLDVDRSVDDRLVYRFGDLRHAFEALIELGSPAGVAVLVGAVSALCLIRRARRAALLVAVGPALASLLAEVVLKPLVRRYYGDDLAFPSGHAAGSSAVALALAVLLLPGSALQGLAPAARRGLVLLVAVLLSAVPLGLLVLRAHFFTDVLAGVALAVACVVPIALVLDGRTVRKARAVGGSQAEGPQEFGSG